MSIGLPATRPYPPIVASSAVPALPRAPTLDRVPAGDRVARNLGAQIGGAGRPVQLGDLHLVGLGLRPRTESAPGRRRAPNRSRRSGRLPRAADPRRSSAPRPISSRASASTAWSGLFPGRQAAGSRRGPQERIAADRGAAELEKGHALGALDEQLDAEGKPEAIGEGRLLEDDEGLGVASGATEDRAFR